MKRNNVQIVNANSDKIPNILGVSDGYQCFIDDYLEKLDGSGKKLSECICEVSNEAETSTEIAYGCYMIGNFMGQKLI